MRRILATLAFAAVSGAALAAPVPYAIDEGHTQILFSWNHLGFSNHSGQIHKLTGELMYDAEDPAKGSISVTIPVDALQTGVVKLDEHLKTADFFDAAQFPNITFKSTKVEKTGADTLKVDGDLTIRGITKPASLAVKVLKVGEHPMKKVPALGFDVTATVKRSDFGIKYALPAVPDEIPIHIGLEAQQPKPKA